MLSVASSLIDRLLIIIVIYSRDIDAPTLIQIRSNSVFMKISSLIFLMIRSRLKHAWILSRTPAYAMVKETASRQ